MVIKEVMEQMGSTNARLREICTTVQIDKDTKLPGEPEDWRRVPRDQKESLRGEWNGKRRKMERDYEIRKMWENEIQQHTLEGMTKNLQNWHIYSAIDMAMDSQPINDMTVPLMMMAQGKIKLNDCVGQLKKCGCSDDVFQYQDNNPRTGKVIGLNLPRFVDFSMNVVKSTIRRRVAAQTNKYSNLWPFMKFDARGNDQSTRVRADAMSTLADIITDDFGLREHSEQAIRYGMMYGRCMDFKRASWEYESHPRFIGDSKQIESKVTKQGYSLFNPHPSRWSYDSSSTPGSINFDTGVNWLFFWDVTRYGSLVDEERYWNTDQISVTSQPWELYFANTTYFNQYLDRIVVPSEIAEARTNGLWSTRNDRQLQFGLYSQDKKDDSVFKVEYYKKLVPSDYDVGDYSGPAWVRFTATSDGTIIGAEFVYSRPAIYLGIDEDENRVISLSMAMELLHFQDAMTNLVTQLLLLMQIETLTIVGINIDAFQGTPEGKAMVDQIRKRLGGQDWSGDPHVIEYSIEKIKSLFGNDASVKQAIIDIKQAQMSTNIQTVFQAMVQLLTLMDRMLTMSPAETGQPAPREISAREVTSINNSTSTVYDAISNNIDTYMSAMKRMTYESAVNCWIGDFRLPLKGRYTEDIVKKAGFKMVESEDIIVNGMHKMTVTGQPQSLLPEYSYAYNTRDGAERPSDAQAAQAMAQTLQFLLQVPQVVQGLGKEKIYEIANEIFRMAGASVSLNLSLQPGDSNDFQDQELEQLKQTISQLGQALQQMGPVLDEMNTKLQDQEQVNAHQEEALGLVNELANQVKLMQQRQDNQESKSNQAPELPKLDYKSAPPSIKSQIELRHGFDPASKSERDAEDMKLAKGSTLPAPA